MSITPLIDYNNSIGGAAMPITVYKVTIYPSEKGGYWATCAMHDGGVNTAGDTLHEVQSNMLEAMELWFEGCPEAADYILDFEVKNA